MHIAFAGRLAPPFTGAEIVPLELLRELVQQDQPHQYSLFVSRSALSQIDLRSPHLTFRPYPPFWQRAVPNILWHQFWLPWLIRIYHIDVLFTPHNRLPLIKTCPQITILHDLAEFRVDHKYDAGRGLYRRVLLGPGVRRADRVVTVSDSSRRDIEHFLRVAHDQIAVIPNGLGADFAKPLVLTPNERHLLAVRYNLPPVYVLYVGAIEHPNKNLVRLIDAFQQARTHFQFPHQLLLVGPPRWRPEVVFAEIKRRGLSEVVRWLGFVPQADLRQLYAAADLFTYVSLWEGFGFPALEAMAQGIPVVVSATSSLPEVVGEAGLLVDPTNVAQIAQAIGRVLTDRELHQRLRQLGLARAAHFSWQRAAQQFRAVAEGCSPKATEPHTQS